MTTWILYICTAGWGLCGHIYEAEYQSETACYRALSELYKRHPASDFKYVICYPKGKKPEGGHG